MSQSVSAREELQQTAAVLEQILEVMPDDLFTLRSLYETLLKLEEPEQALDCLKQLDDGAHAAQNPEMIAFVIHQYESIVDEMPELRERIDRLQGFQTSTDPMRSEGAAKSSDRRQSNVDSEMALAWDLFQDGQLSQEEYSNLLRDLTEMSSHEDAGVPVTVLHILYDRNFSHFERLMTHLCQKSMVPIVMLSQFDEREDLREVLPLDFISRHGALPFAKVGDELLLAVLNPQDKELIRQASGLARRRCHAYLVSPQEYDQRLNQIKKALTA